MTRRLPHDQDVSGRWAHIRFGLYSGGYGCPSVVPNLSQRPAVHLFRAGSNSGLTGFRDLKEAEDYIAEFALEGWKVSDLREKSVPGKETADA